MVHTVCACVKIFAYFPVKSSVNSNTPRGMIFEVSAFTGNTEHAQTVCTRPFPPPPQKRAWVRG